MDFDVAQKDMRYAFYNGATGVFASGLIWCIAALAAALHSTWASMLTLFFGGMLIFPVGLLLCKMLKRPGKAGKNNPLNRLAIETTFVLFIGLFIAFAVAMTNPTWFFPIMLMMIGVRYLCFQTLYGLKSYWLLGALLSISGAVFIAFSPPVWVSALSGGVLELFFCAVIFRPTTQCSDTIEGNQAQLQE